MNLSLSSQGRTYSKYTKDRHSVNKLGTKLSDDTREKMAKSHKGVLVYFYSFSSNTFGMFVNKSSAATKLGVSLRTISRWGESRKLNYCKCVGFEKVILGYTTITPREVNIY